MLLALQRYSNRAASDETAETRRGGPTLCFRLPTLAGTSNRRRLHFRQNFGCGQQYRGHGAWVLPVPAPARRPPYAALPAFPLPAAPVPCALSLRAGLLASPCRLWICLSLAPVPMPPRLACFTGGAVLCCMLAGDRAETWSSNIGMLSFLKCKLQAFISLLQREILA